MDITDHAQRLYEAGFREELLDRAVVLAGAQRMLYHALYDAVTIHGMSQEEALNAVEQGWRPE